jgi:AcrR family transcriptional regulator
MTPRERAERMPAAERREQILDAAIVVFAERGYRVSTTADIAAVAEISQPAVFKHFKSRDELFLAVIDRIFTRSAALWEEAARAEGPPLRTLIATAAAWRSQAITGTRAPRRDPLLAVLYQAAAEAAADPAVAQRLSAGYAAMVRPVAHLLERARDAGEVRPDLDTTAAAWQLVGQGQLYGLMRLIGSEANDPRWRNGQLTLFLRSLGVPEERLAAFFPAHVLT